LELEQLRDWLKGHGVTHVVMESTGSYWKPVFNILEDAVQVYLANPQEVKNRKGPKTDDQDGWWLAHLLRHAMIHPSFIPSRAIRQLRDFTRRRKRLLGTANSERNRVQKVLEDANVKLGNVLSDVFGASGQMMLDALLEGKASPGEIAQLAKCRAKKKIPEIIAALEGHQMSDHHRKLIRYSLEHLRFLEEQMGSLDEDIKAQIQRAGLEPQFELVQSVPAIGETSAAIILAETGGQMKTFPSEKNLSSWAGLCPGNNRSAGKSKSRSENDLLRSRKSRNWLTCILHSWFSIHTRCFGSWNGSGRSSSAFTTLNTVALAPMPRPAMRIAKAVNPASRRIPRNA
jgi:transposase